LYHFERHYFQKHGAPEQSEADLTFFPGGGQGTPKRVLQGSEDSEISPIKIHISFFGFKRFFVKKIGFFGFLGILKMHKMQPLKLMND
jgi:hypothetical protein